MKKSLSMILTVLILLLGCLPTAVTAYAEDELPEKYFHFYNEDSGYTDVCLRDKERCITEIAHLKDNALRRSYTNVGVLVQFVDDYVPSQECCDRREKLLHIRKSRETEIAEHRDWIKDEMRAFYTAKQPEYREALRTVATDDRIRYNEYGPYALLNIPTQCVTPEKLYELLENDCVEAIYFRQLPSTYDYEQPIEYYLFSHFFPKGEELPFSIELLRKLNSGATPVEPVGFFENAWNNVLSFFARIGDFFASLFK